jgi:hypothetical protein
MLVNFGKNKKTCKFFIYVHSWAVTPRCRTCPIKYDKSYTYMWVMVPWWWSLQPNKESPYFMTSVGQLSGGLFNVFILVIPELPPMDGWCHKLLRPTPTIIVLGTCNIGPFFCFPPESRQATMQLTPQSGSSVIFSVKEWLFRCHLPKK